MPKRIPTPPPAEDEPRYLSVVHPYAIGGSCNMELPKDRQDFAGWVACCIDKDSFLAIFHKPSARNMVIIEVNRCYSDFDRILGEHRWSEFLQNPTEDEKERVTRVFYCTYSSGRIVQKNGWKRIDVEDAWFKAWSPNNKCIKFPYPKTHFCDVPVEDRTNHPLCRPLPGAVVILPPEMIATPQPVVGSVDWNQSKQDGTLPPAPSKPLRAWAKGPLQVRGTPTNPTANGSMKKITGISQGPPVGVRMPAVGGGHVVVKSSNVWLNTHGSTPSPIPPVSNWEDSPAVSGRNSPAARTTSPAASVIQAPIAPLGLPARQNAWGNSATSLPLHPPGLPIPSGLPGPTNGNVRSVPDRPTNSSVTSWGADTSSPDSESGPDLAPTTESDDPYRVHVQYSENMEEEFHGLNIREFEDPNDLLELDSIAPGNWNDTTLSQTHETIPSRWDNVEEDAESLWKTGQEMRVTPLLCKAHGVICKKGICAEYAYQLRLAKRAEEAEERKKTPVNKGKKSKVRAADRPGRAGGTPAGNSARDNNAFRGPGAPVKTNWRGAPRTIVSADAIEKRETVKVHSADGWGNSESDDDELNAAAVRTNVTSDVASNASWNVSETGFNPWAATAQPAKKPNGPGNKGKPQSAVKKNVTTDATSNVIRGVPETGSNPWGATAQPAKKANDSGGRRKPQNKPAQTKVSSSWADQVEAASAAGGEGELGAPSATKSSTSGWGTVSDMPW
ncbi:hypothetical protein PAXRUDRAFT_27412 [Paxillus rubicundulus Ve08.2h10]|uniref:Uncharacterized protein n=1 Tax=Paxillus rubicundulus Ve08.2h10 TaxID=930991 RepID=A0A0D0DDP0_9AGAM|nr:hypothetical protein PAXRUDRAFT_27412 [Paxillus rubicundulus Ve08.2h10]